MKRSVWLFGLLRSFRIFGQRNRIPEGAPQYFGDGQFAAQTPRADQPQVDTVVCEGIQYVTRQLNLNDSVVVNCPYGAGPMPGIVARDARNGPQGSAGSGPGNDGG